MKGAARLMRGAEQKKSALRLAFVVIPHDDKSHG